MARRFVDDVVAVAEAERVGVVAEATVERVRSRIDSDGGEVDGEIVDVALLLSASIADATKRIAALAVNGPVPTASGRRYAVPLSVVALVMCRA